MIFVGRDILVCDVYPIKSTKQFVNTLADNIRKRGAMDTVISDCSSYKISKKVTDMLRSLYIANYQSEPHQQHQNKSKQHWGTAKCWANAIMNCSVVHPFVGYLASPPLDGIWPIQALTGTTPNISFLIDFFFYEPVYYRVDSNETGSHFPSKSNEKKGYGLV